MKKPTKKELFYNELKHIIFHNVDYNLQNYDDLKSNVYNFIKEQKHLKKVGKLFTDEIFHFIIAERILELVENKKQYIFENHNFNMYLDYENYIYNKINSIGVYFIKYGNSDVTTIKFVDTYEKKIQDIYYQYDECKQDEFKIIQLKKSIKNLKNNCIQNEEILNIIHNQENILRELSDKCEAKM